MKQPAQTLDSREILTAKSGGRKVILYVRSIAVPSGAFVDREGALHACAQARQKAFAGLGGAAHLVGRVYPDADWQALCIARSVQATANAEIEIIDVSRGAWRRLRIRRQGITKTPQFVVDGRRLPLITDPSQLLAHL